MLDSSEGYSLPHSLTHSDFEDTSLAITTTRICLFLLLVGPASVAVSQETTNQEATSQTKDQAADTKFWESVYSDNHVLEIEINLTSENWKAMQPKNEGASGQGGPGGPGGRPNGRPPGPPPNGRRPGGPPPGGRRGGPPQGGRPQGGPPQNGPTMNFGNEFTYVKAEIVVDGEKYADAGLRFKGNSSYRFSANSSKRPMKIDMNKFNKEQKLHGRDKLNLSNSFLDSAFMKEKLAYDLYKSAGLATPGVGWANVTMTVGRKKVPLGVYVIIEQVDKRFMKSHFGADSKDSLLMKPEVSTWEYLGDKPSDYSEYDIKYGETNIDQFKRFGELMKLIEDASDSEFEAEIGERFDLPQLAGYLAATSLLSSLDSYIGAPHNYYLMLDKADGKLRLLPWDVNESFATFSMGTSPEKLVDWDIDRPWIADRRLLERLFETSEFPALYRTTMKKLMKEFTEEKLFPRIEEYRTAIAPHIGKYKAGAGTKGLRAGIEGNRQGLNPAVERSVLAIKPFIKRRIKSVQAQLAGEREGQTIAGRRR